MNARNFPTLKGAYETSYVWTIWNNDLQSISENQIKDPWTIEYIKGLEDSTSKALPLTQKLSYLMNKWTVSIWNNAGCQNYLICNAVSQRQVHTLLVTVIVIHSIYELSFFGSCLVALDYSMKLFHISDQMANALTFHG